MHRGLPEAPGRLQLEGSRQLMSHQGKGQTKKEASQKGLGWHGCRRQSAGALGTLGTPFPGPQRGQAPAGPARTQGGQETGHGRELPVTKAETSGAARRAGAGQLDTWARPSPRTGSSGASDPAQALFPLLEQTQ